MTWKEILFEIIFLIVIAAIIVYVGLKIVVPAQIMSMCNWCDSNNYTKNFTGDFSGNCSDMKNFCVPYILNQTTLTSK